MREKTSFWSMFIAVWQSTMSYALGISAAAALLLFRLGTLVPGLSAGELASKQSSANLRAIIDNPVDLPYKLVQFATQQAGNHGALTLRFASVVFAAGFVTLFYFVVRSWYTRRVALLTTILLASSSWFLHIARLANSSILLLALLAALAYGSWLQHTSKRRTAVLLGSFITASLIYIPGFIWIVMAAALWQRRKIFSLVKMAPFATAFGAILFAVLLAPLGWAIFKQPDIARSVTGLPTGNINPVNLVKNLANIPLQLTVRGPNNPEYWLGRLPLIDYFVMFMAILGSYAYFFKRSLDRAKTLAGCFIIGAALITVGGPVKMPILLPLIYLVAAGGVALMIQRWFTVFPRNPLARTIGIIIISVAVLTSVYYNLSNYFVAWPQAPETKAVFKNNI